MAQNTPPEKSLGNGLWPARLAELVDIFTSILVQKSELDEGKASRSAHHLVEGMANYFGGAPFYLPTDQKLRLMLRNKSIIDSFTGNNHKQLAQKHKLTVTHVYDIIAKHTNLSKKASSTRLNSELPQGNDHEPEE